MKTTGYLAYAIYNLNYGADFYPLGVYGDEDTAIDMLVTEMEEYNDAYYTTDKVYKMFHERREVYAEGYDSKFAYREVKVEL